SLESNQDCFWPGSSTPGRQPGHKQRIALLRRLDLGWFVAHSPTERLQRAACVCVLGHIDSDQIAALLALLGRRHGVSLPSIWLVWQCAGLPAPVPWSMGAQAALAGAGGAAVRPSTVRIREAGAVGFWRRSLAPRGPQRLSPARPRGVRSPLIHYTRAFAPSCAVGVEPQRRGAFGLEP